MKQNRYGQVSDNEAHEVITSEILVSGATVARTVEDVQAPWYARLKRTLTASAEIEVIRFGRPVKAVQNFYAFEVVS